MKIAIDFDGTLVEHRYPEIGKEIPFAAATLRQLQEDGHKLILWTVREGALLDEALAWCTQRGIMFYAVNADHEDDTPEQNRHYSRKLKADLFIDDRNVGGLPDWGAIYEMVKRRISYEDYLETLDSAAPTATKKKSWWRR